MDVWVTNIITSAIQSGKQSNDLTKSGLLKADMMWYVPHSFCCCLLASSHDTQDILLKGYCETMTQTAPARAINCQYSFEVKVMGFHSYRTADINKHTCTARRHKHHLISLLSHWPAFLTCCYFSLLRFYSVINILRYFLVEQMRDRQQRVLMPGLRGKHMWSRTEGKHELVK